MKKKPKIWLHADWIIDAINGLPADLGLSAVVLVTRAEEKRVDVRVPNVVLAFLAITRQKKLRVEPTAPPLREALSRVLNCFVSAAQAKSLVNLAIHPELTDPAAQSATSLYVHITGEVEATMDGRRFVLDPYSDTWKEHPAPPSAG
jgi:hypothetical protein